MDNLDITRLDHLGIVSGVIDDLDIVAAINTRLQKDQNGLEALSPGEAIQGMILNGLGFIAQPLSLTLSIRLWTFYFMRVLKRMILTVLNLVVL